ncbi:MAG: hypothetical protein ACJ8D5_03370 [Sphingomicrobium sp.]
MRTKLAAAAAFLMLAAAAPAAAQSPPKPLFVADVPIHLTITAPLGGLIRNRSASGAVPGTLVDSGGASLPIALSLRGITRRTKEVCEFPPLRVDFTAPPPAASAFAGQRRLKLVTHCRNSPGFQQYVLLEYAAYRMYNLLTPRSFRARLANIDYRDSDGRPIASRVGFFIEDLDDVARRNGTREAHGPDRIPVSFLSAPDAARYTLFQHMIGNHDWSMRAGPAGEDCCHNAKLIGTLAPGATIPVPYDFDFSGMVDAPYATPPDVLHINNVRQRVFRGYCMHNPQTAAVAAEMRARRSAILGVLGEVPGLDERSRAKAASYLEGFFAEIGTDESLASRTLKRCIA